MFHISQFAESNQQCDEKKGNNIKNCVCSINEFGPIKQVYMTASLLQMTTTTSLFFLTNESNAFL